MRPDPETLGPHREPAVAGDESGSRLGRYELLFALAAGGMGKVYAARLVGAHGFDRVVAIKRLQPGSSDVEGFLKEARVGARVTHANVVQTLELDVDERGSPFIVMQLIEGISFDKLLARIAEHGDSLDCDLAAWIAAQAAAGLHAAHELVGTDGRPVSLVHRDVSPHNLMLSFDGRVYVTDFGIAKLYDAENATTTGTIKGKFAYMSPEQTRGAAVDRRSDVFSLGVVLYEALAGVRPFVGASAPDVIFRVVNHDPDPPHAVRSAVPEELSRIAVRALDKRLDHRYPTMANFGEALRTYLRRGAADVDEHALAEVIASYFPAAHERLRERLRRATSSTPALPEAAAFDETSRDHAPRTETAAIATITQARKRWTVAFLASALVLGSVAFLAFAVSRTTKTATATSTPTTATAMPIATASASASPSASASTTRSAPSAAPSVAETTPLATTGSPRRGAPGRRGPRGATTGAAPPPSASNASAPFRSLE